MTFKTGEWGEQAKIRNERRLEYFRQYHRKRKGHRIDQDSLGFKAEKFANKFLKGSKWMRGSFDFTWNGEKVDVKASSARQNAWKFSLKRQRGHVDYFLAICYHNDKIKKIYLIPDSGITTDYIHIGVQSKYDKWLVDK